MFGLDKKVKGLILKLADNLETKSVGYVSQARGLDGMTRNNLMTRAGILHDLATVIRETLEEGTASEKQEGQ